jgi:hypothetical protein
MLGVVSEMIFDLAMAIISHDNWNPDELHAPDKEISPPPFSYPTISLLVRGGN